MNIVYLSPHFPAHYFQFCRRLNALGANVLGIGDADYDGLSPELRSALTEYYYVPDMHDYDALVRACGYFTHKYGRLDRFESLNEYWLTTEAAIRDDFNLYGIGGNQIDDVKRKSRMKAKFMQAGAPVAAGVVADTIAQVNDLIQNTGYPIVAKPDAGVGALDTFLLENDDDVRGFFNNKPDHDYIFEQFINGDIYSFDGLADRNGNLIFYTSHVFSQGIMETVNDAKHIAYYSLIDIPARLEEIGRACIEAFDVRERFFHIEFFKTGPDEFTGLEVNMRPPGGFTTDMFNYACDIDVYRMWAELLCTGATTQAFTRKYHCCYASRKSGYAYEHTHDAVMNRFSADIVSVASVPGVFSAALGDVGYIFRSPDLDRIQAITEFIHAVGD